MYDSAGALVPADYWEVQFSALQTARQETALFLHHDAITGTSRSNVVSDYLDRMGRAAQKLQLMMANMLQHIITKPAHRTPLLTHSLFTIDIADTQQTEQTEKAVPTDGVRPLYAPVVLFNSLAWHRQQLVSVKVSTRHVRVEDHNGQPVQAQVTAQTYSTARLRCCWPVFAAPCILTARMTSVSAAGRHGVGQSDSHSAAAERVRGPLRRLAASPRHSYLLPPPLTQAALSSGHTDRAECDHHLQPAQQGRSASRQNSNNSNNSNSSGQETVVAVRSLITRADSVRLLVLTGGAMDAIQSRYVQYRDSANADITLSNAVIGSDSTRNTATAQLAAEHRCSCLSSEPVAGSVPPSLPSSSRRVALAAVLLCGVLHRAAFTSLPAAACSTMWLIWSMDTTSRSGSRSLWRSLAPHLAARQSRVLACTVLASLAACLSLCCGVSAVVVGPVPLPVAVGSSTCIARA